MQLNNQQKDKSKNNQNSQQLMFFIDSHTHLLDYERESYLSLSQILKQSQKHNIRYIAANTCCTNQFVEMQKLYSKQLQKQKEQSQPQQQNNSSSITTTTIIPCFGIHPCYICQQLTQENINKDWQQLLKQYLVDNPTSHVGEIGLDFRKDVIETNPQDKQWEFFQKQFQIAIELNRSVTIHCVRAYGELLKFLKKQNTKQKLNNKTQVQKQQYKQKHKPIVILHSYGGSKEITKSLNKLQHLNIYFSLSLKHSKDILEIIPIQKLIVETDAPYQNDNKVLIENGLWAEEELVNQQKEYQQIINKKINLQQSQKQLLKQCKFFNKNVLNNRPMNVVANYKQLAKSYQLDLNIFVQKVTQNALKAFKLLK